jgi:hypothetical protein
MDARHIVDSAAFTFFLTRGVKQEVAGSIWVQARVFFPMGMICALLSDYSEVYIGKNPVHGASRFHSIVLNRWM